LPDGLVSDKKSQIGVNFKGSWNRKCWYILCPFGSFRGTLVFLAPFWYIVSRKIWQPWFQARNGAALSRLTGRKKLPKFAFFILRLTQV
jgi:hypothetical protein